MATKKKESAEKPKITVLAPKNEKLVEVFVKSAYFDKVLKKNVYYGEKIGVPEKRAEELAKKGLVIKL